MIFDSFVEKSTFKFELYKTLLKNLAPQIKCYQVTRPKT